MRVASPADSVIVQFSAGHLLILSNSFWAKEEGSWQEVQEIVARYNMIRVFVAGRVPALSFLMISYLAKDPELRHRLGAAGRKRIEEAFSLEAVCQQLVAEKMRSPRPARDRFRA